MGPGLPGSVPKDDASVGWGNLESGLVTSAQEISTTEKLL